MASIKIGRVQITINSGGLAISRSESASVDRVAVFVFVGGTAMPFYAGYTIGHMCSDPARNTYRFGEISYHNDQFGKRWLRRSVA